ncbi:MULTISPECIES: hypothetical protein [Streptomyces]|uniref:hypothetical protein n=1 Tax=Streptomyces TaxID=1883 RepID=UPI00114C9123|nr:MULTISPECIES: hypothetical protein [unclassified Streptomyces]MYT13789.1 hypothetical protein [Streptomyces sp. SID4951]
MAFARRWASRSIGIPGSGVASSVLLRPAHGGQIYNHRWRQRNWFHRTFRTYENFRAEAIEEARQVRHEKGEAAVVRHLKVLYPHLPAPVITRLIKEL